MGSSTRSFVNYSTPLKKVENENNGYYLISYYTDRPEGKHGYQEVDVRLRNPEFHLKARDGYEY